jgi:hypothetical protein
VTTYEWKYGEPPLKIEEPPLNIKFEDETGDTHADDNAVSMILIFKTTKSTEQRLS